MTIWGSAWYFTSYDNLTFFAEYKKLQYWHITGSTIIQSKWSDPIPFNIHFYHPYPIHALKPLFSGFLTEIFSSLNKLA
jgi:hypothetical protein